MQAERKWRLWSDGGPVCCVPLSSCIEVNKRCGLAVFKKMFAVWPHPLFLGSSLTLHLRIYIYLPAKGRDHLGLSFSSSGLSFFFADKCSPIHPDRCHIASHPLWSIASDPATCNKDLAPGTPLPRQHSDTDDYFKGASLVLLSAKTLAGRDVRKHSELAGGMWVLACVWVRERQRHDTLGSRHRSPWNCAIFLAEILCQSQPLHSCGL